MVEVDLGTDDGVRDGLTLEVFRGSKYLGKLEVVRTTPDRAVGKVVPEADWNRQAGQWLPTPADHAFIESLMGRVVEPGKFANWIAPPARGINGQPVDFEYVRLA